MQGSDLVKIIKAGSIYEVYSSNNRILLGEILSGNDGYYYYWPNRDRAGAWNSALMRAIANTLDELNSDWDSQVREFYMDHNA